MGIGSLGHSAGKLAGTGMRMGTGAVDDAAWADIFSLPHGAAASLEETSYQAATAGLGLGPPLPQNATNHRSDLFLKQSRHHQAAIPRRIPRPTATDFVSLMGLQRPGGDKVGRLPAAVSSRPGGSAMLRRSSTQLSELAQTPITESTGLRDGTSRSWGGNSEESLGGNSSHEFGMEIRVNASGNVDEKPPKIATDPLLDDALLDDVFFAEVAQEELVSGGGGSDGGGGADMATADDFFADVVQEEVEVNVGDSDDGGIVAKLHNSGMHNQANLQQDTQSAPDDSALAMAAYEPIPLSQDCERRLLERRASSNISIGSSNLGDATTTVNDSIGLTEFGPIQLETSADAFVPELERVIPSQGVGTESAGDIGNSATTSSPMSHFLPAQMQQQEQQEQQQQQKLLLSQQFAQAQMKGVLPPPTQPQSTTDQGQTASSIAGSGKISVQAQIQHVALGRAPRATSASLHDGTMAMLSPTMDYPRDGGNSANWVTTAILNLSKVSPKVPDADGLLPIHLACVYCPNDKRLVGNILIDNPDSAVFPVEAPRVLKDSDDGQGPDLTTGVGHISQNEVIQSLTSNALAAAKKKNNHNVAIGELRGLYPLHIALRSGGGQKVTYEVVKLLTLSGPGILTTPDPTGAVPLSTALQNQVGSQIIRYLLDRNRSAAKIADEKHNYPLHVACASLKGKKRYSLGVIKVITAAYQGALLRKNANGNSPLDLARGVSAKDKDTDKETDIGADKDKVKGEISSSDDVVVIFLEKAKKEAEEEERKQH